MATLIDRDVPEVVSEAPKHIALPAAVEAPRTQRMPTPNRSPLFRFAVPMLFASMGISLGTLAGIAFAFATVPVGAASSNSASSSPAVAQPVISQSATTSPSVAKLEPSPVPAPSEKSYSEPAALVEKADNSNNSQAADSDHSEANQFTSRDSPAISPAKLDRSEAEQSAPSIASNPKKSSSPRSSSSDRPHPKPVAQPLDQSVSTLMASTSDATAAPIAEQLSFVAPPPPARFVSEGDLTVADYNPTAGTIETSDGRTFAIGTTVSINTASSWEDYRSNVHYRCGQNGSCMLMRHGVIAPNARLLDRNRSEDSSLNQGI
jgi:hypothetical protein